MTLTNTIIAQGDGLEIQGNQDCHFKNNAIFASGGQDIKYYYYEGTINDNGSNIIGLEDTNDGGNGQNHDFFTGGSEVGVGVTLTDYSIKTEPSENDATNGMLTLGVSSGSELIDAGSTGSNNGVSVPSSDQRGKATYNTTPDIGPFEYQGADEVDPLISSITDVDENNTYTTLTFDEGVYNTDGGSGALEASDLSVTDFTANGGAASDVSITSVTQTNDDALVGGETEIKVNISVTGTANGVETFKLKPADGASIYDVAGNAMSGTWQESDAVTLNGHFDYYVDPSGTDDGSHGTGTGTDAWQTIQYAISNVSSPTTAPIIINISGDIYTTNNDDIAIARNFTDLTLQGAGIDQTIVQPHADPDSASDENFYISSGNNVTFADMTIRYGYTSSNGAAIQASTGDLTIEDCLIYDNDGPGNDDSGGVYGRGNTVISNSTFMENDGDYVSAFYHSQEGKTVEITNSTFIENDDSSVGQIYILGADSTFTNSLVAKGGGGVFLQSGDHYFKNSVIADSDSGYDLDYYYSPTIHNNGYNIIGVQDTGSYFQNGVDGCIVISDDSLSTINFKAAASQNNSTNGSLTLAATSGSSAINAGSSVANNGVTIPTTDQRGQSRVSTVDIGPYEVQASDTDDPVISSITALDENNTYVTITLDEGVYNTDGGSGALEVSDFAVDFAANGGGASDVSISSITQTDDDALVGGETEIKVNISVTGTANGVETFSISPSNNTSIYDVDGNSMSTYQVSDTVTLNGHFDYYVDPTGTDDGAHGTGTGTDAWATIQYAITNVPNPTTTNIIINISGDTYVLNNDDISISRSFLDLTLQGAGAQSTIITPHADPASVTNRIFYISSNTAVTLNDMTVKDGYLSSGSGSGIYISSTDVTLNDMIVDDNDTSATYGAIYASISGKTLTINNSTISNNDSDYVGAIYMSSGYLTMTNSTVYNNSGASYRDVYINGSGSHITNCIFTKGNGVQFQSGTHYIKNSIFVDSDSGYDIDYYLSPTIHNNGNNIVGVEDTDGAAPYILDGVDGCIDIDNDALSTINIKEQLSLNNTENETLTLGVLAGSDVIDAGSNDTNDTISIPSTDQRGKAVYNTTHDIGPYEYQGSDDADHLVATFSPADNATGIATTSDFILTFDENVDVETGNILIYKSDDTLLETVDVTSDKVTGTGTNTITINPTANLAQETEYYITIAATAFDDESSNSYMGISNETSWTFTSADETEPGISILSPANDAANISVDEDLVITFDEAVDAEAGNIYLYKEVGDVDELIQTFNVTSDISGTGTDTITINPTADLLEETEYYVQIDATAFDDSSGNSYAGISDETSWDFTTGDFTNPTVLTLLPANDATDIAIDTDLVITFDENITAGTGNITLYKYDATEIEVFDVSSQVTILNDTVTIIPSSDLQALTEYYVQIASTAIDDDSVNTNSYAGISDETSWDFITAGTAGVTVGSISGNTTEAGGAANFTVVLDTEPIDDVTISVSSSDTSEGTVSTEELTFTSSNWDVPQTVTITGQNDELEDGNIVYSVILGITVSSGDSNYNGINPSDVSITNTDNDTAGVTLSEATQTVTEGGATDTYTVVLNSEPTSNVAITIDETTDEVTTSSTSLTFTSVNWATPQTVTVTAVNDDIDENSETDTVTHSASSSDTNYSGISIGSVTVTVTDNDTAGVTLSEATQTVTEGGATDTYTVVLNSQPTSNVVITLADSSDEVTVSPTSLTFTSSDWNVAQTVTVTAVDDSEVEASQTDTITHVAASNDSNYNSYAITDMAVSIIDNDENADENEDEDEETTPDTEDPDDQNDNGIPDDYEAVDPINEEIVSDSVHAVSGVANGSISIFYKDGTVALVEIFNNDSSKKQTKVKQIAKTGYFTVLSSQGNELTVCNVLNGEKISSKKISKAKYNSALSLKITTLQKNKWALVTAKNKKHQINLAAVKIKTKSNYSLGKKSSVKLKSKKIIPKKTKIKKNVILLKNKKGKLIQKYLFTKKKKLKKSK